MLCAAGAAALVLGIGTASRPATTASNLPRTSVANSHYCDGCMPPLIFRGGSVANTTGPRGLTITPIYWLPSGYSFAPSTPRFMDAVTGYVENVAKDSGKRTNVYSIVNEYYGKINGKRVPLRYKITAGAPVVDTSPFPRPGCDPEEGYRTCVNDAQLRAELARVIKANHLPTGLAAFYPVFFPNRVETDDGDGGTSATVYCGYHSAFRGAGGVILYGNEPHQLEGCDGGQAPNGSTVIEGAIDTLSHEIIEVMTDPGPDDGWYDTSGSEIADICASYYGPPLGSVDPKDPGRTQYNQAIGDGKYYTQSEFSNASYARFGVGNGCQLSAQDVSTPPKPGTSGITLQSQILPDFSLPADGKATTHDNIYVTDRAGYAIAGDQITLSVYAIEGTGLCGTLSKTEAQTDDSGAIDVVYTASTSNAICGITASEAKGGKLVTAPIYQGTFRRFAPTADAVVPESMRRGASATTKATYGNRTSAAISFGTVLLSLFPYSDSSPIVSPKWVKVAASIGGGAFKPLALNTFDDGHVEARFRGPSGLGVTVPAHKKVSVTFRITLAANAPTRGGTPVFDVEAFLDQLNPATGTFTTLADTGYYEVVVR